MIEMTVQVPDKLAQRLRPMSSWLPTVLELSLVGFKTPATQTASEIIDFLSNGPSPSEVAAYTVSERAQERLRRLLTLNQDHFRLSGPVIHPLTPQGRVTVNILRLNDTARVEEREQLIAVGLYPGG